MIKKVTYESVRSLDIELKLSIAMTRAANEDILAVCLKDGEGEELFTKHSVKLLKQLKKNGNIQLFITDDDMKDSTKTETAYMLNKYPFLTEKLNGIAPYILIKI